MPNNSTGANAAGPVRWSGVYKPFWSLAAPRWRFRSYFIVPRGDAETQGLDRKMRRHIQRPPDELDTQVPDIQ